MFWFEEKNNGYIFSMREILLPIVKIQPLILQNYFEKKYDNYNIKKTQLAITCLDI